MTRVRLKRQKRRKGRGPEYLLKPRVILPPNRSFKSGKEYNRRREKDVSRRIDD